MKTISFLSLSLALAFGLCLSGQYYDYVSIKKENLNANQDLKNHQNLKCEHNLDCKLIADFKYYEAIDKK